MAKPSEKIIDLIREKEESKTPYYAIECYPPKTDAGVANLKGRFPKMAAQKPMYADVTWGAGGSTSDLTLDLCASMVKDFGLRSNMHLTCTNMPSEKIKGALEGAKAAGIYNIVALRGDPPAGEERWTAAEGGFNCALDLVKHIRESYGDFFGISVAGYPEGHVDKIKEVAEDHKLSEDEATRVVECEGKTYVCSDKDYKSDLEYLKAKVDAGADYIITQMFFDVPLFFKFVKDCRAIGIKCPIVPGIMLLQSAGGFKRMTTFCKSRVPPAILEGLEPIVEDAEKVRQYGIELGIKMCKELIAGGSFGLHFYSLNLTKVLFGILKGLDMFDEEAAKALEDATA